MTRRNDSTDMQPASRVPRWLRWALWGWLLVTVVGAISIGATIAVWSADVPPVGPLFAGYDPPQTTEILGADGSIIAELFDERRIVLPSEQIPAIMKQAVIAAEDAHFRTHHGIDYRGILRAMWTNLTSGKMAQGASTITQQVARTFYLHRKKTFQRKVKELLLTRAIERELTKDQILFLYLNQINFGHGRYGVEAASRFYFGKPAKDLTLAEAALLAAIPKGPAVYEPLGHPERAKERRRYVLGRMRALHMISQQEFDAANAAPLGASAHHIDVIPEAIDLVIREVADVAPVAELRRHRYRIWTSIDPALQRAARAAMRDGLTAIDRRHDRLVPFRPRPWPKGAKKGPCKIGGIYHGEVVRADDARGTIEIRVCGTTGIVRAADADRYNPDGLPPSKMALPGAKVRVQVRAMPKGKPLSLDLAVGPQAAVVMIAPNEFTIRALIGGDKPTIGGFNRALAARRQPGSAFKPLVYLAALQSKRFTPASLLDDSPVVEGTWKPKNSHGNTSGTVRLRDALAHSLNLPAIKLIETVGPESVVQLARKLGIDSPLESTPALALGASGVTVLELTAAYCAFASGGMVAPPHVVVRMQDARGADIPVLAPMPHRVLAPEDAYLITSLLRSVVTDGTGAAAAKLPFYVAGKTGTTNHAKDAWFVGYSPRMCAGVWVGYDDNRSIGRREQGARSALPIWIAAMRAAHPRPKAVPPFDEPAGIVHVAIDPKTGLRAWEGMEGAVDEIFAAGTEPVDEAPRPDEITPDGFWETQAAALLAPRAVDTAAQSAYAGSTAGEPTDTSPKDTP